MAPMFNQSLNSFRGEPGWPHVKQGSKDSATTLSIIDGRAF